jgi:uncharacterized protein YihD (DUF1040 family)
MKVHRVVEINNLIYMLEKALKKYPDLRLMQLLGNGFPSGDSYYVDDKQVMDYLVKLVNEVED